MFSKMSEEQLQELESKLDTLNTLASLMKIVVGGSIIIGAWVGALQFQVNHTSEVQRINTERVRALEIKGATVDQRLENIYEIVRRIDNRFEK
jgi:hypothetical protein